MKRYLSYIVAIALLLGGCGFVWYWMTTGRFLESTDNAYIRSEITQISAKVQGYVKDVPVQDNMPVSAGSTLVRIEDLEFRVRLESGGQKLEERKATLRVAQNKTKQQKFRIDAFKAHLASAEAEQSKRSSDFNRYATLFSRGIVSALDYDAVSTAQKKARADEIAAKANQEMAEKEFDVLIAEEHRVETVLRQQEEELKLLQKELSDTVIQAPISGVVGNRRVRAGQFVKPGTLLMVVIPRSDIWVEANFKEVQLTRMREGQHVTIKVDTFPGNDLNGRVESLSPASGAEFSIIPPENAAGNFVKIVQRISVKIRLDPGQPLLSALRAGMSVTVKLDTRTGSGSKPLVSDLMQR